MLGFVVLVLFILVTAFLMSNILGLVWMLIVQLAALAGLIGIGWIVIQKLVHRNEHPNSFDDDQQ